MNDNGEHQALEHELEQLRSALIEAVLKRLAESTGRDAHDALARVSGPEGRALLEANTEMLLGPARATRSTRIMVTMPTEAADDARLVASLIAHGMDVARVNCAHDDAAVWARMIANLRDGAREMPQRVAMDLGGPKLRTGPIEPGPRVVRIAPPRDRMGRVLTPALVHLAAPGSMPLPSVPRAATIPVADPTWLTRRALGERVFLLDSRGANRTWQIVDVHAAGCLAAAGQTTYVETGARLVATRTGPGADAEPEADAVRRAS